MLFSIRDHPYVGTIVFVVLMGLLLVLVLLFIRRVITIIFDFFEMTYALFTKRPAFVHFYAFKKSLNANQKQILNQQFTFYNRLNRKNKRYFRHRVASFIADKEFIGKSGFEITEEAQVLVSATAVMLTFGFRDFIIKSIERIIIYPTQYFSEINKVEHKGEFNARLKTLVLSWDNFIEGFRIEDDKLNLGIHEFSHAIHYNSMLHEDINSVIFVDTFNEIRNLLSKNESLKEALVSSKFLRSYALTNDSELLAVIIETFIEAPSEFKSHFPDIYFKVKQMLNFHFLKYL